MKSTKKRGFTIVELVIVIAVIAILAAVLIPTFTNVVTKAKKSAAMQNARSAWTAYLADEALKGHDLPSTDGCIKVTTGETDNTTDYYFEIKAGTFTGKNCSEPTHTSPYTIENGKIKAPAAGGSGNQGGQG